MVLMTPLGSSNRKARKASTADICSVSVRGGVTSNPNLSRVLGRVPFSPKIDGPLLQYPDQGALVFVGSLGC
jgi:hypothetical protein